MVTNRQICPQCGGRMLPDATKQSFRVDGKKVDFQGINGFRCPNCGEAILSLEDILMIDKVLHDMGA